jgi:hypothetical protein
MERVVGYATVGLGCILASATFLFGDSIVYERTNSFAIISASTFFLIRFMTESSGESKNPEAADFAVIRWGLLNFVAFVVWQNLPAKLSASRKCTTISGSSALWIMIWETSIWTRVGWNPTTRSAQVVTHVAGTFCNPGVRVGHG